MSSAAPAYACLHCKHPVRLEDLGTPEELSAQGHDGSPIPLGATWVVRAQAYNFAIYSEHATHVRLLLFAEGEPASPVFTYEFDYLRNKSGPIWHCQVPLAQAKGAKYYAYKVDGPKDVGAAWHQFDADKVLVDPYARAVFFPPGFDRQSASQPGSNPGRAPLGLLDVCVCPFDWGTRASRLRGSQSIIYELHVKGFTCNSNSGVEAPNRGTFAGVVEKIPYLKDLGITAVELMPIFQFDPQEGNYWGYMPLNFFAPHHAYSVDPAACQQHSDFREMVKALHEAGIEAILDVVFNHTCEGNHLGPTYSFKGIDNSNYYLPSGDPDAPYANFSGTGNTLRTSHPAVRQLIVDSLRYWTSQMHIDGFRFDLASIFTRTSNGSINLMDPPIFAEIATDPELATVRLIAEPWDAGGAYQLGTRFPGIRWMQWNGSFRDTLQRFVRGDAGLVPLLMARLYGSADLFPDDLEHACHPYQTVNYVDSHDGFTLYDLVSYDQKHNLANGHKNSDGPNELSWNCGWEGDVDVPPDVIRIRKQQVKNCCCLLLLSNGTPMFRMGDEFLHTQGGNNNPYSQDNATSWLDWSRLESNHDVCRFFKSMIAFRKSHPSLARSRFWRDDVTWYGADRPVNMSLDSHALAFCLRGGSCDDADIYVMINAAAENLTFTIHEQPPGGWKRIVDTSLPSLDDFTEPGREMVVDSQQYEVKGRSVVVLVSA